MLPPLMDVLFAQSGVFTRQQALQAGYTEGEIRARLKATTWVSLRRGIYTSAQVLAVGEPGSAQRVDRDHLLRCAAAMLDCDGAISHQSAARLHRLALLEPYAGRAVITVTARSGRIQPCRHLREAPLPDSHVTQVAGLRVTSAARTVVDIARLLRFRDGVVTADHALRTGRCSDAELKEVLAECSAWPGGVSAQRVIEFADGRSESAGESLSRVVMRELGLPIPLLNVEIGPYRVDFLFKEHKTIVEFDGRTKYELDSDPEAARRRLWREKRREDELRELGFEVVRITWEDITRRPAQVATRIRAAFARAAE